MSNKREYKSGAEKRRNKAQKEESERELLSKIPKLTDLFNTNKNAENENSADLSVAGTSIENISNSPNAEFPAENIIPTSSTEPNADTTTENNADTTTELSIDASNDVIAECRKSMENLAITSNVYSNDPGLWEINSNQSIQLNQSNQSILQKYWTKKGIVIVYSPSQFFVLKQNKLTLLVHF